MLTVELVPQTCWGSNLRSILSGPEWVRCKDYAKALSGGRCIVCGGVGKRHPVECHEAWEYDDQRHVQTLTGLLALCPDCHKCKHAGLAESRGELPLVVAHLQRVNGWNATQVKLYLEHVFEVWAQRSTRTWDLDTTWLRTIGLPGQVTPAEQRTRWA